MTTPPHLDPSAADHERTALVTIAIPTYNRCALLREALQSALDQTYPSIEVLVCDNASTDGTEQFMAQVHDPRVRHVRHATNIGLLGNWKATIEHARGTYLLVLSDDDRLAPTAIADLMELMAPGGMRAALAFVYGRCEMHDALTGTTQLSKAAPRHESSPDYRRHYLLSERVNYPSATLYGVEDARAVGGYGTGGSECPIDTALAYQLSARYPSVGCTGTVTTHYLMHPENLTSSISAENMVASVGALGELGVALARQSSPQEEGLARRTQRLAQARTLNHVVGRGLATRTLPRRQAFGVVGRSLRLFTRPETWPILARIGVKLALGVFGLTGRRKRSAT